MTKSTKNNDKKKYEEIEIIEDNEVIETQDNDYEEIPDSEKIYNIEKKVNTIYILTIITTILTLITLVSTFALNSNNSNTNNNANNNSQSSNENDYTYSTAAFKEIKASDIKSESKNDTIVVLVGRQGCYYCAQFAPTITKVAEEYGITVRYIDFAKIVDFTLEQPTVSDSESYTLIKELEGEGSWSTFGETAMKGTPNTLIIKNNKIIGGINGNQSTDKVKSAFEAAGLKK